MPAAMPRVWKSCAATSPPPCMKRTGTGEEQVERAALHHEPGRRDPRSFSARAVAFEKEAATGAPAGAMVLPDGPCGHRQNLATCWARPARC